MVQINKSSWMTSHIFFLGITPFLGNFVFAKSTTGFLSVFPQVFLTKPLCPNSLVSTYQRLKSNFKMYPSTTIETGLKAKLFSIGRFAILIVWLNDFLYCQDKCYVKLYETYSAKFIKKVTSQCIQQGSMV